MVEEVEYLGQNDRTLFGIDDIVIEGASLQLRKKRAFSDIIFTVSKGALPLEGQSSSQDEEMGCLHLIKFEII